MLYLIGGSPRCGKTTFSRMLAYKKRIPLFSTDLVETIIHPYISRQERKTKLPELNVCTASPSLLLRGEIRSAKTLWPGVERLMFALMMSKRDCILEGVHLLPDFVHKFETMKEWQPVQDKIRIIYLIKKDEQKIIEGFKRSDKSTDWLLQCVNTEKDLHNAAKMVRIKSVYLEKQANKYGYRVVNTENDFQKTIRQLLKEF